MVRFKITVEVSGPMSLVDGRPALTVTQTSHTQNGETYLDDARENAVRQAEYATLKVFADWLIKARETDLVGKDGTLTGR